MMRWEFREFDMPEGNPGRLVLERHQQGWELVGLHQKLNRRGARAVVAIMRRPVAMPVQRSAEAVPS